MDKEERKDAIATINGMLEKADDITIKTIWLVLECNKRKEEHSNE